MESSTHAFATVERLQLEQTHSQLYLIPRAATPRGIKMTATIDAFLGPNAFLAL